MEQRPNFYTLLELAPSVTDWPTIESAILTKRRTWSLQKNQGAPSQRRKAERYLKYIPEMEVLLKDAESCQKEAKAARQEQKKEKQADLEQLDELIQGITTSTVSPDILEVLVRQTGKKFSEKEVEERLRQKGITLDKSRGQKTTTPTRPQLEASVAKGIRDELQTIKLKSLYDFLNLDHSPKLSPRSSPKSLYDRADGIYKELSRVGKTDMDTTLKMSLAGRAKSVFVNDKEKERYDNTQATEALRDLDKHLEVAGHDNFIETQELQSLLLTGKKLGVADALVLEHIENYAAKRKWIIQKEAVSLKVQLPTCGYCDTLASAPQDERCKNCGEELIQPCPKCGEPTPTENFACRQCGCHTGDAPLVKLLLQDGQRLIAEGDFEAAMSYLDRALTYWTDWPAALQAKKLAVEKKKESDNALNAINSLLQARKLESAESQLEKYAQKYGHTNTTPIQKKISAGLSRAKRAFEAAEKLRIAGKTEHAFDKYEEALTHCRDFSVALSALASSPPPAPKDVTTQWLGSTLRLSWPEVQTRGKLSYTVIRKVGGAPSNRQDGEVIADTPLTQADDTRIKPGTVYYYGVFSVRLEIASKTFATSGPHLHVTDATDITYQAGDKQVSIAWQPPAGSAEVEVWRREGLAPSRRGEGKKILVSGHSALDSGLQNERRYGYLIVAKYRHPEDATRALYATGVSILATPVAPPQAVQDLRAQRKDRTVFLSWTPIRGKTQVQIRQTQSLPDMTAGQIISLRDADQFGTPIPITAAGRTQTTLKTQGRVFFVPLSVISETAVLGKAVTVTTLDDVSHLTSQRNGNSIMLTWTWPQGATEVLLAYHHEHFPALPEAPGAAKERVTRSEYENNNYWELRSATRKKHYFTVFVKDPSANIYSSGARVLESMGQETTVRYQVIVKKSFLFRKPQAAWVEFQTNAEPSLEGLLVVLRQKYPPVSKDDGIIVATTEQLDFEEGLYRIEIPKIYLEHQGYIKVFFRNDESAKEVRLLPARQEKLKLS